MANPAPRLIVSTVGTSVLNNALAKEEQDEKWGARLAGAANMTCKELEEDAWEVKSKIDELSRRALADLSSADIETRRRMSAELNGIYGHYKCVIDERASRDIHYLIGTDTYQGRVALHTLKEFLMGLGLTVFEMVPGKLSTRSTGDFAHGIRELMAWCTHELSQYRQGGYRVIFNLVGGFKSLQGYMNTIGMFYADRIEYIFEGPGSNMISIPALPIEFKWDALEPYATWLLMMEQGYFCPLKHLEGLSKVLIDHDTRDATLSTWGDFAWSNIKEKILSRELLEFPRLKYSEGFQRDFERTDGPGRVHLQEKLAKVATLLDESNGDVEILKRDGGLRYENYKGGRDITIGHFRISQDLRVSCHVTDRGHLYLRKFGAHDYVNNDP